MYVQILGILFTICENLNLNSDLILFLFPDRTDDERFVQKKKKKRRNWLDHDKWSFKNEINHELWFFLFLQSLSFFFANTSSLVEKFLMAKILDYIDLSPSE